MSAWDAAPVAVAITARLCEIEHRTNDLLLPGEPRVDIKPHQVSSIKGLWKTKLAIDRLNAAAYELVLEDESYRSHEKPGLPVGTIAHMRLATPTVLSPSDPVTSSLHPPSSDVRPPDGPQLLPPDASGEACRL